MRSSIDSAGTNNLPTAMPAAGLPAEIHAKLVGTLFDTAGSFIAGILGGLAFPAVVYAFTKDPLFLWCSGVMLFLAALRLGIFIAYRKSSEQHHIAHTKLWEQLYATGAILFMTAGGVTVALFQVEQHDAVSIEYGVAAVLAIAGAIAARNAARPFIVYAQCLGIMTPLTLLLIFSGDFISRSLGVILLLVPASVWSTTRALNKTLLNALLSARAVDKAAHYDALTNLPNRYFFQKKLDQAFETAKHNAGIESVFVSIDLDGFKEINDCYGHPAGDMILARVADRLAGTIRSCDTAARFGGDEFAVLLTHNRENPDTLDRVVYRIIAKLTEPYILSDGTKLMIGASVGTAVTLVDGKDPDELMRNGDLALYAAKADHRSTWRRYDPSLTQAARTKRDFEYDLRQALDRGELRVHYQPIVDITTHKIKCAEALMRWSHPQKGMIPPGIFIPVAEETGLIIQIGELALTQACNDAVHWPDDIRVAVNVSPVQFHQTNIVMTVARVLKETGLKPDRLELEITESVILKDTDATLATITALCELGVRLSLDDFGTGYSSLSYINRFPFQKVKIDRAFVLDLKNNKSRAVIGSITHLAREIDIDVVAEGVETEEQLATLVRHDVTEIQGYYFSKPRPINELNAMLTKVFSSPLRPAA